MKLLFLDKSTSYLQDNLDYCHSEFVPRIGDEVSINMKDYYYSGKVLEVTWVYGSNDNELFLEQVNIYCLGKLQ